MVKIYDLYSKRKREEERSGEPDVYQYNDFPKHVRNQIFMILDDALGRYLDRTSSWESPPPNTNKYWNYITEVLSREYGEPSIGTGSARQQCQDILTGSSNTDRLIDLIEFAFRMIDKIFREMSEFKKEQVGIKIDSDEAIAELNYRLRESGVGYQFENGKIIRVDSQYVHAEITKKALALLHDSDFMGRLPGRKTRADCRAGGFVLDGFEKRR